MIQSPRFAAVAALALLAAPGFAQDSQSAPPPAQQPVDVAAPPAPAAPQPRTAAPRPAPAAPQAQAAPAPDDVSDAPPPPRARAARPAPVRTIVVAPPPVPTTTTTTTSTAVAPPVATLPSSTAPTVINAAPSTGIDTVASPATANVTTRPQLDQRTAVWPWFLFGALLIGAAALLLLNRRRAGTVVYEENAYEPAPRVTEAVAAAPPVVVPAAEPEPAGVPAIALAMRPLRAGVEDDCARVEFELTVDNRGTAEARQVTVSTLLLAGGASEAERSLIAPDAAAGTPPIDIPAGEARTVQAAVALPRGDIKGDSLLPVVVADASYRLPDGSEARVSARFAVGLPDGEELARFDAEHPSGLHEGVVARTLGDPEPV